MKLDARYLTFLARHARVTARPGGCTGVRCAVFTPDRGLVTRRYGYVGFWNGRRAL